MPDLSALQAKLQKRAQRELKHVVLLHWGVYPGVAIGPLGLLSTQRVLAWDADVMIIFSGWLRKVAQFDISETSLHFSPRPGSFYGRFTIHRRTYWVYRDFFGALEQLVDRSVHD